MLLNDNDLHVLAEDLEAVLNEREGYYTAPRLLGLVAGPHPRALLHLPAAAFGGWVQLAQGDPYQFLDLVRLTGDDVLAVALISCGWSLPAGHPDWEWTRPSQHRDRVRARVVTMVTPDGRTWNVIRQLGRSEPVVSDGGDGPMLRALQRVWEPDEAA
ncbi:MAG TPA: hypothetical protein VF855_13350 [Acidimicrobiales bacterium]